MNEQQIEEKVEQTVNHHKQRIEQRMIEYGIPAHMHGGVLRYIEYGTEPGGFMNAVLCNDYMGAAGRADDANQKRLYEWACFINHAIPALAWGSKDVVDGWTALGGLRGIVRQKLEHEAAETNE